MEVGCGGGGVEVGCGGGEGGVGLGVEVGWRWVGWG